MSRRAAGEGSIYPVKDKQGKTVRYAASVSLGYHDGKRCRKKVERKTRREVAEEIARLKAQQTHGVDLVAKQPLVCDYGLTWLNDVFALNARPKSVETYRQMFTYHIFPAMGQLRVNQVTHRKAQALITAMHRAGFADKTIGLVRAAGRQMYAAAMQEGLHDRNPFQGLTLPTGHAHEVRAVPIELAYAFLREARGERLEVALRLLLSLGLRRGEVCGLRWDLDVDLEKGTLTVNGTLQYIRGRGLVWGEPKTKSGRRSFKLAPALRAALVWFRQQQELERRRMGDKWTDSGYVFVSPTNGGPLNSNAIYVVFKRVAARAGLPDDTSPHTLRHSCASFLHAEGAPIKRISAYLGHANTVITSNLYVHLFQDEMDEAADVMDTLLEKAYSA